MVARAMRCALAVALLLCSAALLAGCKDTAPSTPVETLHGSSMGTTWTVKLAAPPAQLPEIRTSIDIELTRLIDEMSTWEPDSTLSRFNNAAPGSWHPLPEHLHTVLTFALDLARATDGAYDPTIGPLVNLWGFGPDGEARTAPPSPDAIAQARARVGWQRIAIDEHRALQPGGITVDVSSLGPGYAVDRIAARLQAHGVNDFLIELGGEMRASGTRADGQAWRVAVERPDEAEQLPDDSFDLVIRLDTLAAGSSGDYRVGFEHEGIRYSHTIDPRTGAPVTHGLAAVTVLAPTAMEADASAAALMVLGPERGWEFAVQRGLAAAFTQRSTDGYTRRLTPTFEARRVR